jgi:hypothetical protein
MAQHMAATPTQITPLSLLCWLWSQVPNIWLIDHSWVKFVAKKIILQIALVKGQSMNKCWIVSFILQQIHFWLPFPFFLARLSLVKTTPFYRNQRKILILRGIFIFQSVLRRKGGCVSMRWRYIERTENNPDLVNFHLKKSEPPTNWTLEIFATKFSQFIVHQSPTKRDV